MVRNESIDSLKGILIIFVIIGHALHGTLDENILRYVIYSFHMPVFLFISGYLINLQRIQSLSAKDLLVKYWKRMLFPWGVALFFYSFVLSIPHFTLLEFVEKLSHPYYHLWYVPTLFVFICIVWMITHVKERTVALIFLVALGLIFSNMHIKVGCLRMCYFIFFMFGVISKNSDVKVENLLVSGEAVRKHNVS